MAPCPLVKFNAFVHCVFAVTELCNSVRQSDGNFNISTITVLIQYTLKANIPDSSVSVVTRVQAGIHECPYLIACEDADLCCH